jgi:protein SCO1/2
MKLRWPILVTTVVAAALLVVAVLVAQRSAQANGPLPIDTTAPSPRFALRAASDARQVTEADLRGKVALVYFGFTTCPDICPGELGWMIRTLRALGPEAEQVVPVMVTVDPERDSPALLSAYVANFSPRLLALTGDEQAIRAAADAFGVVFQKTTPVSQQAGFYLIDHTMSSAVLDRSGRLVRRMSSRDLTPTEAAAVLRRLLEQP